MNREIWIGFGQNISGSGRSKITVSESSPLFNAQRFSLEKSCRWRIYKKKGALPTGGLFVTDNLVTYNLVTHNLVTHNLVTHNLVTHNLISDHLVTNSFLLPNCRLPNCQLSNWRHQKSARRFAISRKLYIIIPTWDPDLFFYFRVGFGFVIFQIVEVGSATPISMFIIKQFNLQWFDDLLQLGSLSHW